MQDGVTVAIPAHNGQAFIADAIESVLAQSFAGWRLVVCDDASTDGTREVVRRYAGDPRIELIESATNLGMAGNWNRALEQVRSPYFTILCQDDLLYRPDALEAGLRVLREHPEIPAVFCDLAFVNGAGRPLMLRRFRRTGAVDSKRLARLSVLQTRNAFGVALLFRTAAAQGARYDPALALTIDVDFAIAVSRGGPVFHLPEPLIGYRYHGRNQTGVLLGGLTREMAHIAGKNGMRLGPHHRFAMRAFGFATNLGRRAVLWWAQRNSSA